MKTFDKYTKAVEYMEQMNKIITDKNNPLVVVAGPEDAQGTVMPLRDAIDNDFCYEWSK